MTTAYDFSPRALDGQIRPLDAFRGQVLLVVNTASRCGFTPQYAGLEALHRGFSGRGFAVLGFPCNQFGHQEPGDEAAVGAFCSTQYDVTFPMFAKVDVNGPKTEPLFAFLKGERPGLFGTGAIKWNFTKFLVGPDGRVRSRHAPTVRPEALADTIGPLLPPSGERPA